MTGHQLKVYNSLGRRIEDFTPSADVVGLYSCGPTVYYFPHLGNMRTYVFADTLRRALRWKQIPVRHVINITDVGHAVADSDTGDDKLEVAAAREERTVADIAHYYTQAFFSDLAALNILPADDHPRASDYVEQMIEFARRLEERGVTYQIPSGLYFDTTKSPGYGELALMDIAGQREAARVEQVEGRRNKTDFALWRAEEPGVRRIMRWDSPWGWGAPGWHLECSVMSMELLGHHFDLHTGGIDHRELHHVNEIAQSQAYLDDGQPWVKYWLHGEFLLLNSAKIAKSAGPVPRLADLVEDGYHPMAYRLFLLGGHYRSQLDFTTEAVDGAQTSLRRLLARIEPLRPLPPIESYQQARTALAEIGVAADGEPGDGGLGDGGLGDGGLGDKAALAYLDQIDEAISTDLATPRLLATLQESLRDPQVTPAGLRILVAAADALLGLRLADLDPAALERRRSAADLNQAEIETIERLIADRTQARQEKNWARADEIRADLDRLNVQVTDTPTGPTWHLR